MIKRYQNTPIMHRIVKCNGIVSFGGITARDTSENMLGQTQQVLRQLEALLDAAGTDRTKVVSVKVYLSDFSGKDAMNQAWNSFFSPEHLPTRATVGVADLGKGVLIEIVATAAE